MSLSGLEIFLVFVGGFHQWWVSKIHLKRPQFDTYARLFLPTLSLDCDSDSNNTQGLEEGKVFILRLEIIFFIEFIPGQ